MFRTAMYSALLALAASASAAQEWNPFTPSGIGDLTRAMNCESYAFSTAAQSGRLDGPLSKWLIFNEGPGSVVIRGGGKRTPAIAPFDGRIVTFPGVPGVSYYMSLAGGGKTNVHICRV